MTFDCFSDLTYIKSSNPNYQRQDTPGLGSSPTRGRPHSSLDHRIKGAVAAARFHAATPIGPTYRFIRSLSPVATLDLSRRAEKVALPSHRQLPAIRATSPEPELDTVFEFEPDSPPHEPAAAAAAVYPFRDPHTRKFISDLEGVPEEEVDQRFPLHQFAVLPSPDYSQELALRLSELDASISRLSSRLSRDTSETPNASVTPVRADREPLKYISPPPPPSSPRSPAIRPHAEKPDHHHQVLSDVVFTIPPALAAAPDNNNISEKEEQGQG